MTESSVGLRLNPAQESKEGPGFMPLEIRLADRWLIICTKQV